MNDPLSRMKETAEMADIGPPVPPEPDPPALEAERKLEEQRFAAKRKREGEDEESAAKRRQHESKERQALLDKEIKEWSVLAPKFELPDPKTANAFDVFHFQLAVHIDNTFKILKHHLAVRLDLSKRVFYDWQKANLIAVYLPQLDVLELVRLIAHPQLGISFFALDKATIRLAAQQEGTRRPPTQRRDLRERLTLIRPERELDAKPIVFP